MKIESLNCRIWGRLREGRFPANGAKIHPSAFILHPCSLAGLVIKVDGDVHDLQKEEDERGEKVVNGLCHGFTDRNGRSAPRGGQLHPCSSAGLVIEVDGDVHDLQKEEDERREPPLSFGHLPQIRQ